MNAAQSFMIAAGKINDAELTSLMRTTMLDQPGEERFHWLKLAVLALDGYGERHFKAAERVATVLHLLESELHGDVALTATASVG